MDNSSTLNLKGVLVGGLVAGVLLVAFGALSMVAVDQGWASWLEDLRSTPPPLTANFSLIGAVLTLAMGMWAVWLYAAIRPRYGAGPETAVVAGLAAWLIIALVNGAYCLSGAIALRTTITAVAAYLLAVLVATLAGAALYIEEEQAPEAVRKVSPLQPSRLAKPAAAASSRATEPMKPQPAKASPQATMPPQPQAPASPQATVPPKPKTPATDAEVDEARRELHKTVVGMELNDEIAVHEVLKMFNKAMPLAEIVEHLTAVNWNFGGMDPQVSITAAIQLLMEKGKVKQSNGDYELT